MPKMKNVSERTFVIAGKELKKGAEDTFAQSVIDAHVSAYPNELVQVEGGEKEVESPKEETKPVVSQKEPETEDKVDEGGYEHEKAVEESKELEEKSPADAPRRGRKPKAKE